MADYPNPGIYLIIRFNWPAEVSKEMAEAARRLHDQVVEADWVDETVAASGGLGGGPSSLWIFHLEDYATLDRLLKDRENPVAQAYFSFFSQMVDMDESIREGVAFL